MNDDYKKYSLYFRVDEDYFPMINPDSIPELKWEATYAHKSFVEAISDLEKMLSRGSSIDKKGLWIEGAYGTGKSRLIWTLQNLLDCSPEKFKEYFNEYELLRKETDLRDKILAAKARKVVTAYRYGSGEITSTKSLINAVFDSMTAALKNFGCKFNGAKTLRGRIIDWLEADAANFQLFRAKLQSPKYRGQFGGRSAEDVLDQLKNSAQSVDVLVDNILMLGEAEGIRAFEINIDDLKTWLAEIIDANELKAVVFLWDEFSDFFKHNRNNLGDFQKLAELSNSKPFYIVIATHESGSLAAESDKSFKIVSDRFFHREITMPDNIAFELIGHALKINPHGAEEWQNHVLPALADRTEKSRAAVADFIKADEKVLNAILPLHPMAALMLKYISNKFASNQRSMFNFIKSDKNDVDAFQKFIETKSPDLGDLLTIDYLWEFFYEKGADEHTDEQGRSNLNLVIASILDTYPRYEKILSAAQKVVLKTVLMMEAITRKAQKEKIRLLQPSAANLRLAFEGVDEYGGAVNIARDLIDNGILYKQPGAEEIFAAAAVSGDQAGLDEKKQEIEKNFRLSQLVDDAGLMEEFNLSPAQGRRFKFEAATLENFTSKINRITNEAETYQIRVVVCFARDEAEQQKFNARIKEILPDERYHKLIVIAAQSYFGLDNFNRLIEYTAHAEYWRTKDTDLAKQNQNKAENIRQDWKRAVGGGSFLLYPSTKTPDEERKIITCANGKILKDELDRNILAIYPLSFDNADVSEGFFLNSTLRKGAELGIRQETSGVFGKAHVENLLGEVWRRKENYWELQPMLTISKLKIKIDAFIDAKIKSDVRVSFGDIFNFFLQEGFMPCNIYAFLTGFLLKEYAHEPYRYSIGRDGDEGGSLTVEKLATFIDDTIKHFASPRGTYREKYIEVMSRNQREFMKFAHEIFGVKEDLSVEQGAQKIRGRITELGYPVWCYVDAAAAPYKNFMEDFSHVANGKERYNVAALAERMGNFLLDNPTHFDALKEIFMQERACQSLENFLRELDGGIIFALSEQIGLKNIVDEVRKKISKDAAAWLWDKETATEEIRKLIVDYKIIAATNALGIECKSINACVREWNNRTQFIRVPCKIISEYYPALKKFFELLCLMVRREELPHDKREIFLVELQNNSAQIREALTSDWKILAQEYAILFSGLNEDEIKNITKKLPPNSFIDESNNFTPRLRAEIEQVTKAHLNFQLKKVWKKITGSESPQSWSKKNRTPILALVPLNERDDVKKIFDTFGASYVKEDDIKKALEYLTSPPDYFKDFDDKAKIDAAFRREVIGNSQILFKDVDEVRAKISNETSEAAYLWHTSATVKKIVKDLSKIEYDCGASNKVVEKLMAMNSEQAKNYLIRLVKENYKIGIEILTEGD